MDCFHYETAYTDVDKLEITTLENAIYMNYKNDSSFVFDFQLMLYEHQSAINPNMPLRDLFYVTRVLQVLRLSDAFEKRQELPFPEAVEWAYKNGHEDGHREGLEEGHREGEFIGFA